MSEISVKEAYKVMQAACGIKGGNDVKVLMKPQPYANGWEFSGCGVLDEDVGCIFTVEDVQPDAIILPSGPRGGRYLPCFAVELVEKAKPVPPIMVGGDEVKFIYGPFPTIEVCGVTVHKETLRQILDRLEHLDC